ncbi:hypothetical protein [Rhizobium sp. RU20A]|uniref:hypothetical protein n=1 Tax=Rhizobium sp. RU20A TaxID=1907412 RepID=UPI00122CD129|nr:hypothetical protein [Rhizobium sp. RU20A]
MAAGLLAAAPLAMAGDYGDGYGGRGDRSTDGGYRFSGGPFSQTQQPIHGGNGLPSVVPGIGTYTGGLSAVRIPGNGVYIQVDHNRGAWPRAGVPIVEKNDAAKIIHVTPSANRSACSYEAGVCVVRP